MTHWDNPPVETTPLQIQLLDNEPGEAVVDGLTARDSDTYMGELDGVGS